jgi:hypothetical protein
MRPDPELLPIHRPRCPRCQKRMISIDPSPGPQGFEQRTYRCRTCEYTETDIVACDPLQSNAVGRTEGELKPPKRRGEREWTRISHFPLSGNCPDLYALGQSMDIETKREIWLLAIGTALIELPAAVIAFAILAH